MLKIKTTIIGMLSFTSSLLFAGTMGEQREYCTFGSVAVPCEDPAWGLTAEALYLQPLYSSRVTYSAGIIYPGLFLPPAPPDVLRFQYQEVKAKAGFGFLLEGFYRTDTGNDLTVNWQHFNNSVTHNLFGEAYLNNNVLLAFPSSVQSRIDPQWNALNFEFGQKVFFGDFEQMRFHAGVAGVEIKRNSAAYIVSTILPGYPPLEAFTLNNLRFRGLGPRAGLEMNYRFGYGIAIYGKSAAALFLGSSRFSNRFLDVSQASNAIVAFAGKQRNLLVPELELKLGITYTMELAQGDLTLDLGGMAIHYFNPLQTVLISLERAPFPIGQLVQSDFSMVGGYLGLRWTGLV